MIQRGCDDARRSGGPASQCVLFKLSLVSFADDLAWRCCPTHTLQLPPLFRIDKYFWPIPC
jgi:hypothetical protein